MMRTLALAGLATLALVSGAAGQEREALQRQVVQRFMENVRVSAGLTDTQFDQFQRVLRQAFDARAQLAQKEREIWSALEGQMRPGIAADADSVARLLDALVAVETERTRQVREEQQAFAQFLTPVQRAQVTMAFRRLQQQIERIRQGRALPGRVPPGL